MKKRLKILLHFSISIVLCFILIYLFVLFGGWKLFEPGDPISYAIAAAIGMGFVLCIVYELVRALEARITEMEKRIDELEKKSDE